MIHNDDKDIVLSKTPNISSSTTYSKIEQQSVAKKKMNIVKFKAIEATPESFKDYGRVIQASPDGDHYGPHDAHLTFLVELPVLTWMMWMLLHEYLLKRLTFQFPKYSLVACWVLCLCSAVGCIARKVVQDVRRQFIERPDTMLKGIQVGAFKIGDSFLLELLDRVLSAHSYWSQ